jgi:hypothetical protein
MQFYRRIPALSSRTHHGAFLFRNAFFYLYWENDTSVLRGPHGTDEDYKDSPAPYLLSLAKTRRLAKIHKSGVRSKYIVRPQDVVELGNHVVWEFAPGRLFLFLFLCKLYKLKALTGFWAHFIRHVVCLEIVQDLNKAPFSLDLIKFLPIHLILLVAWFCTMYF